MKIFFAVFLLFLAIPAAKAEPFQARPENGENKRTKVAEGDHWFKREQQEAAKKVKNSNVTNARLKQALNKKLGKRNGGAVWSNLNE